MNIKKCSLVIDIQNGVFNLPCKLYKGEIILDNIANLIVKARKAGVSIIYMQHYGNKKSFFNEGSEGWKIHSNVAPSKNDIVLKKLHPDSFRDTKLDNVLKSNNINNLVICGFVTEGCVDATIIRANILGYNLEVVSDGHSTTDSNTMTAEQIIIDHNEKFKMFSKVIGYEEIVFEA